MAKGKKYEVLIGGHICLDIIPDLSGVKMTGGDMSSLIVPGKLINIGPSAISTGGAVSNTGFALSKLGAKVAFSTKVGKDYFGQIILAEMEKYGSSKGVSVAEKTTSSYTIVVSPPNTDRTFLHCTGANDTYSSKDLPEKFLRNSQIFHFGYPPLMRKVVENDGAELLKIFKKAKKCGCITSLDMSLPDPDSYYGKLDWRKILRRVMPYVDIFLPSLEEAYFMFDKESYLAKKAEIGHADMAYALEPDQIAKIANMAIEFGALISVLKLGTRGWLLISSDLKKNSELKSLFGKNFDLWCNKAIWCPAFETKNFVGSTGSGDCSIAGFLRALIAGFDPVKALKAAVCVGWQNVQRADSLSGVRTWKETVKLIEKGNLTEIASQLEGKGWVYDKNEGVWIKGK